MLKREWHGSIESSPWRYFHYVVDEIPINLHYHPEFELTLTRNSNGVRIIGNETTDYSAVDLVLVAPNQPHSWSSNPNLDDSKQIVDVVFFDEAWVERMASNGLPELISISKWLKGLRTSIVFSETFSKDIAVDFDALYSSKGPLRALNLISILNKLEIECKKNQSRNVLNKLQSADRRLQEAIDYINNNYTGKVTLEDVGKYSNLSSSSVKRLLRLHSGTGLSEMLAKLRIEHACNLLIYTDKTLNDIAFESGFNNISNFYRVFFSLKMVTPLVFRKMNRN